ncbi:hypothetical protein EN935_31765 [Mesorhizobium sp. M7D.F.Ca.US.004.03.1.1]|uniref:hypothetical protein n=1 Tax=Mesorhizobium sp. M7D.F.Ca.US.004.03.1.1 TaxID=2496702 RepID=UPI000FCB1E05|nr:hypothetical protein [Mesorhizobium sp. M7D.F.Ca.US.004.03.1.1]RVA21458.1 hypothetical protein EN935_31765 [Mesorhizobium sp. M7D.F.Ca.US.004.03.1.1]
MFSRSRPFTARQARWLEAPLTAACSCLMGMVLLAMLCLGRPAAPAFADSAPSGARIGVERSGEVAALLRVTGKVQALEVRAVRPALVKFAGAHPALPVPDAVFPGVERTLPGAAVSGYGAASAPRAGTNQPRAPPGIAA